MTRPLSSSRLTAIDVLRGITVALMIVVNDPGDATHRFAMLAHSAWHGCTLADLVFPSFLFVVGITTHLSAVAQERRGDDASQIRRSIFRRAAALVVIGVLLNAWPFYEKSSAAGPDWLPSFAQHVLARAETLRLTGVLQRIGVVYGVVALFTRRASTRAVIVAILVVSLSYWGAMTLVPFPGDGGLPHGIDDPANNLAAWLDRQLLDWTSLGLGWHLWDRQLPFDPEGLASTVSATATALLGVVAGRTMLSTRSYTDRARTLCVAGAAGVLVGLLWSVVFPLNKSMWSGSFVLFTAGITAFALGLLVYWCDVGREAHNPVKPRTLWTTVPLVFGTNPIVAYVGAELTATIFRSSIKWRVDGRLIGTDRAVTWAFEQAHVPANVASLAWAIAFTALWYVILRALYQRRLFVRI